MSKSIYLNAETQTEDREIISVCHVNTKMIGLETSLVAQKMFRLNKKLFHKLNSTTKLVGGTLYRQEVFKSKASVNKVSVPVLETNEHREIEISKLVFENDILTKLQRAINKNGRKFTFDPTTVLNLNNGGFFDEKKLSPDDIRESTIITTVQEINLFQRQNIKTFLFTDNLELKSSLLEVGYRIELQVRSGFKDYVNYVIDKAEKSITFLNGYLNSLQYPANYNSEKREFVKKYSDGILFELGLSGLLHNSNLGTDIIKNSDFGKVGVSYYNLMLLMREDVDKSIYSEVLKKILPTNKTTPETISKFLSKFSLLLNKVRFEYLLQGKSSSSEGLGSKGSGDVIVNTISSESIEKITIEQERLGYTVFSEKIKGLNTLSLSSYNSRIVSEQTRHYPSLNVDDASKFLRAEEQRQFSNTSNASAFLTPVKMIMGNQEISTTRGMVNIPINKIRQFRLAKSARFIQQKNSKFPQSISKGRINQDSISTFNVTISTPKPSLLERPFIVDLDPFQEVRRFVSKNSPFSTNNPLVLLRQYKRILSEDDRRTLELASDIVPRRFLRNEKAIKSIKELQFSNKKSRVRKLASAGELDFSSIPPQVKFMMSKEFNPNPNSDPLKNRESRQIVEETQKNLFVIRALTGFKKNGDGFLDVYNPIYQNMERSILNSRGPILAKAYDYEVPELGIVKDKFAATIYSNLIYIRG